MGINETMKFSVENDKASQAEEILVTVVITSYSIH